MRRILNGILIVLVLSTVMSMCISNNSSTSTQIASTSNSQATVSTTQVLTTTSTIQSSGPSSTETTSTHEQNIDITKLHFYMFGVSTCPHCGKMKQLLPEIFGKDKFTYYELQGNEHNTQLFSELYNILGVTGVPVIGIFYDNHLVAVIEGEIPDPAKNVPWLVNTALKENGVLFIADKTYLFPSNQTETIKKLENIFMNGEPSEG
ncbi:glutaredoxin [Thermococcus paralvinellae]|uniref:Glutaredoxin domain-containing protein n=1 Tax=Thermococcus paralvinellae TaxID=582419 RepID=W0I2I3_9EURY|nr:glutaredoxin [Thermococcus paralvinellae]AHF80234.1 Hypothetical protein TES1_0848 [Thermococcus paralvinellae]